MGEFSESKSVSSGTHVGTRGACRASSEHSVRMNVGKVSGELHSADNGRADAGEWGSAKQKNAGKSYCSVFEGRTVNVDVDADGWGVFSCPFGGLEVWVPVPIQ